MADVMPTTPIGSMLTVLNTALTEVDMVSQAEFMPAVTTTSVALLAVPFSYQVIGTWETLDGDMRLVHRIQFEFWIKHVQGKSATTAQYAYDLGTKAMRALKDSDGTGYSLDYEPIEYTVDANPVTVNNMPWIVGTLAVGIVTSLE
jgi:hypothetical protein